MVLLKTSDLRIGFFESDLFRSKSLTICAGDKIALLGENGAGKTTLLKVLENGTFIKEGHVWKKQELKITSFQQVEAHYNTSVREIINSLFAGVKAVEARLLDLTEKLGTDPSPEVLERYSEALDSFYALGGYDFISEMNGFIERFDLNNIMDKKYSALSEGEKQYLRLACVLFTPAELLLLDEPFNYLDYSKVTWLQRKLKERECAVMIVSHLVEPLQEVCNQYWRIEHEELIALKGDYQKSGREYKRIYDKKRQNNSVANQKIKMIEDSVEQISEWRDCSHDPHKHAVVIKRLKRNAEKLKKRIQKMDLPPDYRFSMDESQKGTSLNLKGLHFGYGDEVLYEDLDFHLAPSEHALIVGENGVGKTTFLRQIAKCIREQSSKSVVLIEQFPHSVERIKVSQYLSDEYGMTHDKQDVIHQKYFPRMQDFLNREVETLSFGEKQRLQISAVMESDFGNRACIVILDEPTTHMDKYTKRMFIDWVNSVSLSLIIATHDQDVVRSFEGTGYQLVRGKDDARCSLVRQYDV
ncbi:MAG: ATP-binding cassette domain-containing protein [Bacillota bacterium]|nr:ATP-binding cassette domain-containing protein [Bacillota bacterium]